MLNFLRMEKYAATCLFLISSIAMADPQKSTAITQKNSQCSIVKLGGEYPTYKVMRGKKELFAPESDGIVSGLISPSGKYVALSAGETELIDAQKGKKEFGVVVVNCRTGKVAGYSAGQPTLITKWANDFALSTASGTMRFREPGRIKLP